MTLKLTQEQYDNYLTLEDSIALDVQIIEPGPPTHEKPLEYRYAIANIYNGEEHWFRTWKDLTTFIHGKYHTTSSYRTKKLKELKRGIQPFPGYEITEVTKNKEMLSWNKH